MSWRRKLVDVACQVNLSIAMITIHRKGFQRLEKQAHALVNPIDAVYQCLSVILWSNDSPEKYLTASDGLLEMLGKCSATEYLAVCTAIENQVKASVLKVDSFDFQRQTRRLAILFEMTTKPSVVELQSNTTPNTKHIASTVGFLKDMIHMIFHTLKDICIAADAHHHSSSFVAHVTYHLQELIAVLKVASLESLRLHRKMNNCHNITPNDVSIDNRIELSSLHFKLTQWLLSLVAYTMTHASKYPSVVAALHILGEDIENERY